MVLNFEERYQEFIHFGEREISLLPMRGKMEHVFKRENTKQVWAWPGDSKVKPTSSKDADTIRRETFEKCLPNLHQMNASKNEFKQYQLKYHSRTSKELFRQSSSSKTEQSVELPGIDGRPRRKIRGSGRIHVNEASYAGRWIKNVDAVGCSPIGGNSSSASELSSESRTSGKGNTGSSPRRKLRVPAPLIKNVSVATSHDMNEQSQLVALHRVPRPPNSPRCVFIRNELDKGNRPISKRKTEMIVSDDDSATEIDKEMVPCRPKTPALRKSRNFKSILQNIQEQCIQEDSSDPSNDEPIIKRDTRRIIARKESPSSPRRRSVGCIVSDGDENPEHAEGSRRMSMPVDLYELRKQVQSIKFINVRELSQEFIQQFLSRREEETAPGMVGSDSDRRRRQKKCLSWLLSLQQSQ